MNHNLKPINNTFATDAYGMTVSIIAPPNCIVCGYDLEMADDAHSTIDMQGRFFIYSNQDSSNLEEWLDGFKLTINGEEITIGVTQMSNGIENGQAHIYDALYCQWGSPHTLLFRGLRKPDLTPMDYAKALVEDKLRSSDPGVGAIYTREVMERVLADFLGSKLIEVTTNEPGCNAPINPPWED